MDSSMPYGDIKKVVILTWPDVAIISSTTMT